MYIIYTYIICFGSFLVIDGHKSSINGDLGWKWLCRHPVQASLPKGEAVWDDSRAQVESAIPSFWAETDGINHQTMGGLSMFTLW